MHVLFSKKVLWYLLCKFVIKGRRHIEVDGANSSRWDLYDDIAGDLNVKCFSYAFDNT